MLRENNTRVRFLEQEEIIGLLSNCNDTLKPIVVTALNTGMRLGEILGLHWQDIDFQRGIISLHDTKNGERRELPRNAACGKRCHSSPSVSRINAFSAIKTAPLERYQNFVPELRSLRP